MKNFLIILVLLLVGYVVWTELCREFQPPDGYIVVNQADWDSLESARDTLIIVETDTIPPPPDTVWIQPKIPIPLPVGDVNLYLDSIYTPHMELFIQDSIQGILTHRRVGYNLLVPERVIEYRERTVTVPFPIRTLVYNPPADWRYYAMASGGVGGYGLEGGMIRKERWMFGVQGLKIKDDNYALLKVGIQF